MTRLAKNIATLAQHCYRGIFCQTRKVSCLHCFCMPTAPSGCSHCTASNSSSHHLLAPHQLVLRTTTHLQTAPGIPLASASGGCIVMIALLGLPEIVDSSCCPAGPPPFQAAAG